ncbi:MFS general substrate transporter [Xylariaceae sp. FL1272]|nr:MFS general substrate transporter [Xylariaceae sp. FL1272]
MSASATISLDRIQPVTDNSDFSANYSSRESLSNAYILGAREESESEVEIHDAGIHGYMRILGAFFVHFITLGLPATFGTYQSYYEANLLSTYSSSDISWIGAIQVFLLSFLGIFSGALYDRGYMREVLIPALAFLALAMVLLSFAHEFWHIFLTQGVCLGLGSGLVYVPSISAVSNDFTTHRALAIGVAASGAAFGGVIWPIAFRQLLPSIGFAWTNRIFALIVLILAVGSYFSLTSGNSKTQPSRRRLRGGPVPSSIGTTNLNQEKFAALFSAFNGKPYLFLCGGVFFILLGYWIPLFYIVPYASVTLGTSSSYAPYLLSILNAGSLFGRVIPAYLGRVYGTANILLLEATVLGVLVLLWVVIRSVAAITAWCFFLGFTAGSVITIPNAVASRLSNPSNTGLRLGIMWTAGAFAELVGTPIAGTLVTQHNGKSNYLGCQLFGGLSILIGASLLVVPTWSIFKDDKMREARTA